MELGRADRARRWLAIGAGWLAYGLVRVVLLRVGQTPGMHWSWTSSIVVVCSMALFWAVATPAVFALSARVRPDRLGLGGALAVHTLAALGAALGVTLVRQLAVHLVYPAEPVRYLGTLISLLDFNLITYATLAVLGTTLDRHREYVASRRRTLSLLTQLAEARLQFLQRQLQPHFLFNALNTVAELARESPRLASRTLLNVARLLRSAMDHADDPEVTVREELATLAPFLEIQRLRFSDSLDIELEVDDGARDAFVPPMLLQPLIENAVRHGRAGRGLRGRVTIVARRAGTRLTVRVEDDGARFSGSFPRTLPARTGHGIGLQNTTERLQRLYGADHSFALRLESDGTTIAELDLPYRCAPSHPATAPSMRSVDAPRLLRMTQDDLAFVVPIVDGDARPDGGPRPDLAPAPATPTAVERVGAPKLSARAWLLIAAGWAAAAAFWMTQGWLLERMMHPRSATWTVGLVDAVSAVVWLAETPIVLWLARVVRVVRPRIWRPVAFHLAAAGLLGALHLTICLSIGVADRPLLSSANVNPFTLDLCIYLALLAWSHMRDFTTWYRARSVDAACTEAAIARARLDASAVTLHTPFVLDVLEATAALATTSAARTELVVERLADLLRVVLRTSGQDTRTVRDELWLLERCLDVHAALSGTRPTLHTQVDEATLSARVAPGVGHAAMEQVLARGRAAAAAGLRVDVDTIGPANARELRVRVWSPARGGAPGTRQAPAHSDPRIAR
jgi:two-component system, LytTR family, sensor kinase